jgi:hypothetical protein
MMELIALVVTIANSTMSAPMLGLLYFWIIGVEIKGSVWFLRLEEPIIFFLSIKKVSLALVQCNRINRPLRVGVFGFLSGS